ncbi:MAG: hypothetical protein RLP02_14435 [Coleofasciculus sp. C2-GNP5-27]
MNTNEQLYRSLVSSNTVENQDSPTISFQKLALNDIAVNEPKSSPDGFGLLFTSLGFLGVRLL